MHFTIRPKTLFRKLSSKYSTTNTSTGTASDSERGSNSASSQTSASGSATRSRSRSRKPSSISVERATETLPLSLLPPPPPLPLSHDQQTQTTSISPANVSSSSSQPKKDTINDSNININEKLPPAASLPETPLSNQNNENNPLLTLEEASPLPAPPSQHTQVRRQSIVGGVNAAVVSSLIVPTPDTLDSVPVGASAHTPGLDTGLESMASLLKRKVWVKRPGASATLVQIREDDLVDDVRDMILRKYANSLGKTFDAPDMTLRIATRVDAGTPRSERLLGPEEEMCRTIDAYYPGGQSVEEALLIDVPQKRTPRLSPRPREYASYHALDDFRPPENGSDYFPAMPAVIQPALPQTALPNLGRESHHNLAAPDHSRSMAVLNTGQLPSIPSPGSTSTSRRHRNEREHRPRIGRQHTSSPTIITHSAANNSVASLAHSHRASGRPRVDSTASESVHANAAPIPPPLPSPIPVEAQTRPSSTPSTPSIVNATNQNANAPRSSRPKKTRRSPSPDKPTSLSRVAVETYPLPNISSMLDASVPPISVLIVEDNMINLRVLEGLMKRLKVRWQTALNGQIAVDKWRCGGYHLVLMDIQMPVMNGLQATKEIRRLERVNGIGVFSSSTPGSPAETSGNAGGQGEVKKEKSNDRLDVKSGGFKSPVIIVALTASSLQSDRHEALAAGCNDFLTKPVNFVWLERKVKEWGCMQALIDFDGWRKWKDYADAKEQGMSAEEREKERIKEEKARIRMEKMERLAAKQKERADAERLEKERRRQRESLGSSSGAGGSGEIVEAVAA